MIEIDKHSGQSVHQQVVNAMRFRIAGGQYRIGGRLPATRKLASQLGISFHTVRKAYQQLEEEGLVEARAGSGFIVKDAAPLSKSERMERGASILGAALKEAVGIGLDEEEITYLLDEQISLLESEEDQTKIVIVTPFRELGQACASQLSEQLQRDCETAALTEVSQHADADLLLVPFRHVKQVLSMNPRADVIGTTIVLGEEALAATSRLLDHETLGLVTRYSDAIAPLLAEIRAQTKFSGQVLAVSVDEGDSYVASLVRQSELLVYTPGAERRVRPFIERARKHVELTLALASSSVERVRSLIP